MYVVYLEDVYDGFASPSLSHALRYVARECGGVTSTITTGEAFRIGYSIRWRKYP